MVSSRPKFQRTKTRKSRIFELQPYEIWNGATSLTGFRSFVLLLLLFSSSFLFAKVKQTAKPKTKLDVLLKLTGLKALTNFPHKRRGLSESINLQQSNKAIVGETTIPISALNESTNRCYVSRKQNYVNKKNSCKHWNIP